MLTKEKPKIAVLMATYNGEKWLSEQLESILNQQNVDVKLIVSDDMSTDGTIRQLEEIAKNDNRISILPHIGKFRSASQNFYRLIRDADISDCHYVAFADQDDIWLINKLIKLAEIAVKSNADGVSSNVIAFWQDGRRSIIDKAGAQRRLDFLFESSGPGCTFLMTPWLIQQAKSLLLNPKINANQLKAHDWLMYSICRASGRSWVISKEPTVEYRQHENNELGVHKGFNAILNRLQRLNSGWYKAEVVKTCRLCLYLTEDVYVKGACEVILGKGVMHKLKLLKFANQFRRSITDRIFFGLSIIFNVYK